MVNGLDGSTQFEQVAAPVPRRRPPVAVVIALLVATIAVFIVIRLVTDVPHLVQRTVPDDDYNRRYVEHPWQAYLHIVAGAGFLGGALLQLPYRIRRGSYAAHRRRGRVLVVLGAVTAIFAVAFGLPFAFGGRGEATATLVFSAWMLACLLLGFRAARRRGFAAHRRWMVRSFATALAVGSIRLWIGLFQATGLLDLRSSFAPAFWIAFTMHVAFAEVWLRTTRPPPEATPSLSATGLHGREGR